MKAPTSLYYEFDQFRLDVGKQRLTRDGEIVSLTPKAFETLRALVERRGVLVERDELMDLVWPGTIVEPGNLDVTISKLRNVLKEKETGQKFIETLPRLGYRFVAEVREIKEDTPALVVEKQTFGRVVVNEAFGLTTKPTDLALTLPSPSRRLLTVVLPLLAVLVFALGAFAYFSRRSSSGTIKAGRNIGSIAVLPFRSLGPAEVEGNYLGSGIADALITRLGALDQLTVRPTSAVMRFDNPRQDSLTAARALGVDAVLEGSYQRQGERLRVTVQLVSARDGGQIWASTFDEEFKNILAVQDSISREVAHALVSNLSDAEQRFLAKRPTANIEAYQAYLKGRYFWNKRTPDGLNKSLEYFNQAIAMDPNYALAHAGLADSYALLSGYHVVTPEEGFPKARSAVLRALEIDDELAEAHTSLAFVRFGYEKNWQSAEREYKRASELNPSYVTAHHWYAEYLSASGRHDEASVEIKRALEIDPLSAIINTDAGKLLCFARRYDEAIKQLRDTLELDPNFIPAHRFLGETYEQLGMYAEATAELKRAVDISKGDPAMIAVLGHIYATSGNRSQAEKLLEQLRQLSGKQYVSPHEMAVIYAGLDQKDLAFEFLSKAVKDHTGRLVFLKVDPLFNGLRSDPRFGELLRQVNVPG